MHRRAGITKDFGPHKVADLVESFVVTPEKLAKMGVPPDAVLDNLADTDTVVQTLLRYSCSTEPPRALIV